MRKNLRNLTCIALSAVMVAGLAACGGGDTATETTTAAPAGTTAAAETTTAGTEAPAETTAAESAAETTAAGSAENTEGDGIHYTSAGGITYPLENATPLTLWDGWNQLIPASVYADYTESPFHTGLAERTGVDIEYEFLPAGANSNETYNLMMTEEVLPDIIYKTSWKISDGAKLMDNDMIWDLTDYLPVYAPDYWELIQRPENHGVIRACVTDDDRYFNVMMFCEGPLNDVTIGPVIRQDWLDECGLEAPVTLQDWENVLVAFKEKYNVAPFCFETSAMDAWGLASGTGAYATFAGNWYVDDNGQVQLAQLQPEWKEYMEWLHKWYDMGLINKDVVAGLNATDMRSKALNGEFGVAVVSNTRIGNWIADARTEGTGANWVGLAYPRESPDQPINWTHIRARCVGHGAAISKSCSEEEMIEALKWLNYGYTEEGIKYWNYGTEGVSYYVDDDGVIQWTDTVRNDPDGFAIAREKYIGGAHNAPTLQTEHYMEMVTGEDAVAQALHTWSEGVETQKHYWRFRFTDEELQTYNDIWAMINTHISETSLQYMTGDLPLDGYDDFVQELNDMGAQEARELAQTAYDRYIAK